MTTFFSQGAGGSVGGNYATDRNMYVSDGSAGAIWYVHYTNGTDAVAPAGLDRHYPLKTAAQAHTNASDGDVVVFLDGHDESFSSELSITKSIVLVGEGSNAGVPGATFRIGHATANVLSIDAPSVILQNIRFRPRASSSTGSYISIAETNMLIDDCYFELDENNDDYGVLVAPGADQLTIRSSTFVSTATASRPLAGLFFSATSVALEMEGVVFDGGTTGFIGSSGYPYAMDATQCGLSPVHALSISLLRGANVGLSTVKGYFNVQTSTGGGQVVGGF